MPTRLTRFLPACSLALLSLCWGYSWVWNKQALMDAGPFTFSAYRMLLASTCLLLALPLTRRTLRPEGVPHLVLLGIMQTTGFVGLSMWALVEGGVGATSILVFTMPFWTMLMAWPVLGEQVRGLQWVAVALAGAGLLVILHPWDSQGSLLSKLLGAASGMLWAAGSVLVKYMQMKQPRDLLSLTAWQMTFGAIPLLIIASIIGEPPAVWSGRFIYILLVTSLVSTAFCWWLWTYVLKHVDAGIAGLSMLAVPVIAIASSAWRFGERPHAEEMIGMSLILLGLLVTGGRALHRRGQAAASRS
jgi:drug/metabolite transporter (DMT)-like permease